MSFYVGGMAYIVNCKDNKLYTDRVVVHLFTFTPDWVVYHPFKNFIIFFKQAS